VVAAEGYTCLRTIDLAARCVGGAAPPSAFGLGRARDAFTALAGVTSLSASGNSACAVRASGETQCWNFISVVPTSDVNLDGIHGIDVAVWGGQREGVGQRSYACVRSRERVVHCGGDNTRGQLGDGTTTAITQVQVPDLENVARIYASGSIDAATNAVCPWTCAILEDRSVRCWGCNRNGQLGDGTREDRHFRTAPAW